jgi:ribosome-interacting GTPase 1
MSNNIETLRDHLFKTLDALSDPTNPMDVARAKAISDVAQTIINSAMVEVKHAQVTGVKGSTFLTKAPELPPGITGVHQHRLR